MKNQPNDQTTATVIEKFAAQEPTVKLDGFELAMMLLDDRQRHEIGCDDTATISAPAKPSKLARLVEVATETSWDINAHALRGYRFADKHVVGRASRGARRSDPLRACVTLSEPSKSAVRVAVALGWYALGTVIDR